MYFTTWSSTLHSSTLGERTVSAVPRWTLSVPISSTPSSFSFSCPDAMAAKYRLSSLHYDGFYNKLVRPKLTDFLVDERKRQRKEKSKALIEPVVDDVENAWNGAICNAFRFLSRVSSVSILFLKLLRNMFTPLPSFLRLPIGRKTRKLTLVSSTKDCSFYFFLSSFSSYQSRAWLTCSYSDTFLSVWMPVGFVWSRTNKDAFLTSATHSQDKNGNPSGSLK